MKNLRKPHPLLKPFRQQTQKKASGWPALSQQTRIDLSLQFILLPLLEANKELTQTLIDQTLPVAVDLERQASALLAEGLVAFSTMRDLLDKTAGVLMSDES